jgi:arylsulfatase A-like enzyme/Tfp pilus assembly protein PilF
MGHIPVATGSFTDGNILLITLDTVRADRIGCYGYTGAATPAIDELARRGVRFSNAFTPAPSTLPGHASILTGLYPHRHGARANGTFRLAAEQTTLAEILEPHGYACGAFVAAHVLDRRYGLDQGFDLYDDDLSQGLRHTENSYRERPGNVVVDAALAWVRQVAGGRFFAWVHLFDPHGPYVPPDPYASRFAGKPYDGEIAFVDEQVGRLVAGVRELTGSRGTLVVVAADHGESLGEHGETEHSLLIYDATMHTPLVVSLPGEAAQGLVIERQVSNVDIVPTLLDLVGIETGASYDGSSLLRLAEPSASVAYLETLAPLVQHGWSPLFGIRRGDAKYILAPRPELYDLAADPRETKNIIAQREALAEELRAELETRLARDGLVSAALGERIPLDRETQRRLEALGYVSTVRPSTVDPAHAARLDPKEMVPHFERVRRANGMVLDGRLSEGLAELETCLERWPDDRWTLQLTAAAYLETTDLDKAQRYAERALELDRTDPYAHYQVAQVHFERGRTSEAERFARQALELDPRYGSAFVLLGSAALARRDHAEARGHFDAAIEVEPGVSGPAAYNAIGWLELDRKDLAAAREAFQESLRLDSRHGPAYAGLAELSLTQGRFDEAAQALRAAVEYMPTDFGILRTAGALHLDRGEHEQAVALSRRAAALRPDDPAALELLATALRNTGDLSGAAETLERALVLTPRSLSCLRKLADLYSGMRREEQATEMFERVLELDPRDVQALSSVGRHHARRGEGDVACDYFRRAVEASPDSATPHVLLGAALRAMGNHAEALRHLEQAVELDPHLHARLDSTLADLRGRLDSAGEPPPHR